MASYIFNKPNGITVPLIANNLADAKIYLMKHHHLHEISSYIKIPLNGNATPARPLKRSQIENWMSKYATF